MAGSAPARCSPAMIPAEVLQSPDITTGQPPNPASAATAPRHRVVEHGQPLPGIAGRELSGDDLVRLEREVQVGQVLVQVVRDS